MTLESHHRDSFRRQDGIAAANLPILPPRGKSYFCKLGTGSCPPLCHGPHLTRRRTASRLPRNGPCTVIASRAYSEHDGVNRQRPPKCGPSVTAYASIRRLRIQMIAWRKVG